MRSFVIAALASVTLATPVFAEQVEITLVDDLDGQLNGYCIDIKGGNRNVDTSNGLQSHTCYSYRGELGTDQIFDTARFASNELYMPVYEVCAEVAGLTAGSALGLADCDGSEAQQISFEDDGTLRPVAAAEMCLTSGEATRSGRNPAHLIKELTLENCADDQAVYQTWRVRSEDD